MENMFVLAIELTSLPTTAPNLTNVTSMKRMFYASNEFDSDI